MHRPFTRKSPRGAALPLSLILLGVLTVVAVAAVSLSGQERVNAAAYSRIDFINECATAAQAKIWSELAYQGSAYLTAATAVGSIRLPDGSLVASPAHYDSVAGMMLVKDLVLSVKTSAGPGGGVATERDATNTYRGAGAKTLGGSTEMIIARCVDANGRALEIEFAVKFAL